MDWSLLGFKGLGQVFNVHPVFVHFPIALFPTALLFYFIGVIKKRNDLLLAGQICLGLGFISALITVLTGYLAEESFPHGETIHRMMGTHEILGYIVLGFGILLTIWSFLKRKEGPKAPKLFLLLLGFTVLVTLQNADLGARMVFVEGAAVKAMPAKTDNGSIPERNEAPHDHTHHH